MGAFFTNFQIRSDSIDEVKKALVAVTDSPAYISPAKDGWVTVYTEASEGQNEQTIREIVESLSKTLKTASFAFLVHDSDFAMYWLYQNGKLLDEFNSCPEYFGDDIDPQTRERFRGKPEILLPFCVDGTTQKEIEQIIHTTDAIATGGEECLVGLANLLGIDEQRISLGFKYFKNEGPEILDDASEFETIAGRPKEQSQPDPETSPQAPKIEPFFLAIDLLIKRWCPGHQKEFNKLPVNQRADILARYSEVQRVGLLEFLRLSKLPNLPHADELQLARDQGPAALAKLLAKHSPDLLPIFGAIAIKQETKEFLAALLAEGADPHKPIKNGETLLTAAEKMGAASDLIQLLKSAAGKK